MTDERIKESADDLARRHCPPPFDGPATKAIAAVIRAAVDEATAELRAAKDFVEDQLHIMSREQMNAQAECDALRSRIAEMEEAAKPFAEYAARLEGWDGEQTGCCCFAFDGSMRKLTLNDCRRLAASLAKHSGGASHETSVCPRCEGTGRYSSLGESSRDCAVCDGVGIVSEASLAAGNPLVHRGVGSDLMSRCGMVKGISGHDQVRLTYVDDQVTRPNRKPHPTEPKEDNMDSPVVKATLGERERCLALIRSRRGWKPSDISELIRWIESGCDEDTPPLPPMGEPWRDLPDNLVDQLWEEVETEANVARDPSWLSDDRINRVKEGYGEELAPAEVLAALGELRVLRRYVAELESDRDKFAVIRDELRERARQMNEQDGPSCYEPLSPCLVPINRLLRQRDELAHLCGDILAFLNLNKEIMKKAGFPVYEEQLTKWKERFRQHGGNPNTV